MHELAVARQLLGTVEAEAGNAGAERVLAVRLRLGERSHVSADALRRYFALLAPDHSCAAGAELQVERVPMRFDCPSCHRPYPVRGGDFSCPRCRGRGRLLDPGDQLTLVSLEVTP